MPAGLPVTDYDDAGFEALLDRGRSAVHRARETAMVLYTSGSTGAPRACRCHDGHLWAVRVARSRAVLRRERLIVAAPLFHMNALGHDEVRVRRSGASSIVLMPQFRRAALRRGDRALPLHLAHLRADDAGADVREKTRCRARIFLGAHRAHGLGAHDAAAHRRGQENLSGAAVA